MFAERRTVFASSGTLETHRIQLYVLNRTPWYGLRDVKGLGASDTTSEALPNSDGGARDAGPPRTSDSI